MKDINVQLPTDLRPVEASTEKKAFIITYNVNITKTVEDDVRNTILRYWKRDDNGFVSKVSSLAEEHGIKTSELLVLVRKHSAMELKYECSCGGKANPKVFSRSHFETICNGNLEKCSTCKEVENQHRLEKERKDHERRLAITAKYHQELAESKRLKADKENLLDQHLQKQIDKLKISTAKRMWLQLSAYELEILQAISALGSCVGRSVAFNRIIYRDVRNKDAIWTVVDKLQHLHLIYIEKDENNKIFRFHSDPKLSEEIKNAETETKQHQNDNKSHLTTVLSLSLVKNLFADEMAAPYYSGKFILEQDTLLRGGLPHVYYGKKNNDGSVTLEIYPEHKIGMKDDFIRKSEPTLVKNIIPKALDLDSDRENGLDEDDLEEEGFDDDDNPPF